MKLNLCFVKLRLLKDFAAIVSLFEAPSLPKLYFTRRSAIVSLQYNCTMPLNPIAGNFSDMYVVQIPGFSTIYRISYLYFGHRGITMFWSAKPRPWWRFFAENAAITKYGAGEDGNMCISSKDPPWEEANRQLC
jgi:hypothetical protein